MAFVTCKKGQETAILVALDGARVVEYWESVPLLGIRCCGAPDRWETGEYVLLETPHGTAAAARRDLVAKGVAFSKARAARPVKQAVVYYRIC